MKIVHIQIVSDFFGEELAYQDNLLPKYHRKDGHDVTIVAPIYSGIDLNTGTVLSAQEGVSYLKDGIKLVRIKPDLPYIFTAHLHLYRKMAQTIVQEKPDLLFAHGLTSLNYRFLIRYKREHPEVKIVFDNHADWVNSCKNWISRSYSRFVVRPFVTSLLPSISDTFYGVTPARCDFLNEMYGIPQDKIKLLPLGADDDEMHLDAKNDIRKAVRSQFGVTSKDFLIVTGGKIDPLKNIHILAKAVSNSRYEHIKLLVFGSIREDLKETFSQLQSNRVFCVGWVPSGEVYRYFYAADLVMFPGLHSVLWEQAVASQVPCAFSRIKGFEHVDLGANCVMMEGKDAAYYQQVIEQIYADNDLYNRLIKGALSEKSRQFLYSQIAQKVIEDSFPKQ